MEPTLQARRPVRTRLALVGWGEPAWCPAEQRLVRGSALAEDREVVALVASR